MSPARRPRSDIARRLARATPGLAKAATRRMQADLPWYSALSPEDRSWIGVIAHAGIKAFVTWYDDPDAAESLSARVYGEAPRALTGAVSLQQTVELVRTTMDVVEERLPEVLDDAAAEEVRQAVLVYGREVAFATAEVYARAAEMRGAWDARLEALVVDSILRSETDETLLSRASALGWRGEGGVVVVVGRSPDPAPSRGTPPTQPPRGRRSVVDEVHRAARTAGLDALASAHGARLVVVLGEVEDPLRAAGAVLETFGAGPVVVGPVVGDLAAAGVSARAAEAAYAAARGWPAAPRPASADDLLAERVIAGDQSAEDDLLARVVRPLADVGGALEETVEAYLAGGSSVEGAARILFVHPNTVRYRLRRAAEVTGLDPLDPRDGFTLRIALTVGRLRGTVSVEEPHQQRSD